MKYWIIHGILITLLISVVSYRYVIQQRYEQVQEYGMELSSPPPYTDSTIVIPKRAPEVTTIVIEAPRSNTDRIMDLVTLLLGIGNLTVVYFQLKDRKRKND
jgi:hypothetical protein